MSNEIRNTITDALELANFDEHMEICSYISEHLKSVDELNISAMLSMCYLNNFDPELVNEAIDNMLNGGTIAQSGFCFYYAAI